MTGALEGIRIVELAALGPGPFAAMMLADHGAEVVRVERAGHRPAIPADKDILNRSRAATIAVDLKSEEGVAEVRALIRDADGLIEGFRPGVMERLGLGPDALLADNPRLVYGRMTGWGQEGPLADAAGHDINYIALAGALHTYGRAGEKPTPPVNAVADFGGGGMMMAFAMLAGILSAQRTGQGQVIDCAMVDGAALVSALTWSLNAAGMWTDARGVNLLDTGAAFYDSYECADGKFLAVGALEPHFYAALCAKLGIDGPQMSPDLGERLTALFKTRSRDEWCALLEGSDACVAPILSLAEAPEHPHNRARGTFVTAGGVLQPAPAPRFSATPARPPRMGD
ncbi:CaiB/BaiF CoA-transferase family protein [Sphingosinicella sp. LY1275]|uniref:CaiB/BaiF CoA transferase family protein n=1 Tax=Sphingosinicella sp. LY1275 TaxID=3095379 RepID=UPI002ADEE765|nr:CaiB/BaiF CoA-transferase family protein [Sphingosinicella sp. LY1275]MEA1012958.1 CaiB/BaiF CoA-transferase family protein [Sphingosinicella sp. LY1275]